GEAWVVVATGKYIGEGFDDSRLDTLFLAMPISGKGTIVQYTGRLQRSHPGKKEVRIYDYMDSGVPMLRGMFKKRLVGYRAIGYRQDEC
ncbi:MAG: restriction endonuclease subunit R, partial [Actinomycetia bacterium]|nr:restriction endonuclease subunit R [Actinomycetes bacterium]